MKGKLRVLTQIWTVDGVAVTGTWKTQHLFVCRWQCSLAKRAHWEEIKKSASVPCCAPDWISKVGLSSICLNPVSHFGESKIWKKCSLAYLSILVNSLQKQHNPRKYNRTKHKLMKSGTNGWGIVKHNTTTTKNQ
jgi:hypothetical protein